MKYFILYRSYKPKNKNSIKVTKKGVLRAKMSKKDNKNIIDPYLDF